MADAAFPIPLSLWLMRYRVRRPKRALSSFTSLSLSFFFPLSGPAAHSTVISFSFFFFYLPARSSSLLRRRLNPRIHAVSSNNQSVRSVRLRACEHAHVFPFLFFSVIYVFLCLNVDVKTRPQQNICVCVSCGVGLSVFIAKIHTQYSFFCACTRVFVCLCMLVFAGVLVLKTLWGPNSAPHN